jgi:tocopherol cyclase
MLKQMLNPDLYHGRLPWNKFEGWYFKISFEGYTYAFIPGIFHGDSKMEPHSFIQVLDGQSAAYDYIMFPVGYFKSDKDSLELNIGENRFSLSQIILKLDCRLGKIDANLKMSDLIKWNSSKNSSRSMGFYNFIPFMECYSQVCVMDMFVSGHININDKFNNIENCRGYIEKNWGSQFPISWLWVQSNNFSIPAVSLSASVGHIPFFLGSFKGFLIGLNIESHFYEFTSMNGSRLTIRQSGPDKVIYVRNNNYHLELQTQTDKDKFILCKAPKNGQMVPLARETLCAKVHVKLTDLHDGITIFEDTGFNTGIEYGGEPASS